MTMPINEFRSYKVKPSDDKYYSEIPSQRLDDLPEKYEGEINMSVMISTHNRQSQLQRSLETLARQSFRAFEVLLNNDNSTQDFASIVETYSEYLNIQYFQGQVGHWVSCPSKAFKRMLPHAKGEVIVISHPEMMIDYSGLDFLYKSVTDPLSVDGHRYIMGGEAMDEKPDTHYWGILRPAFIEDKYQSMLDDVDWHTDLKNIQQMPMFPAFGGFAGHINASIPSKDEYPWWFVGGALKSCPVWNEMPEYDGHGIIDMWLCDFRRLNGIVDVLSRETLCYHQAHFTHAFAPIGENEDTTKFAKKVMR